MASIRIDKLLCDFSYGTRTEVKRFISNGLVKVNDIVVTKNNSKIDTEKDVVKFDGVTLVYNDFEYYMLNKPVGVISATEDRNHKTVMDLLVGTRRDLAPVGRLDIDTEGLLLITNDGQLAHNLLAPGKHVMKKYYAKISGNLPDHAIELMRAGIELGDGFITMPADLEIIGKDENGLNELILGIHEGKFHQVKRMFHALDCEVVFLKRISMGSLVLDSNLKTGEYRKLTESEIQSLKNREDRNV